MEFGVWFTVDGGANWTQLKGGIPTTQARDLQIQRRENDLVVGTFGRGAYILDDYSALRGVTAQALTEEARLFPLRDAYIFDELSHQTRGVGQRVDAESAVRRGVHVPRRPGARRRREARADHRRRHRPAGAPARPGEGARPPAHRVEPARRSAGGAAVVAAAAAAARRWLRRKPTPRTRRNRTNSRRSAGAAVRRRARSSPPGRYRATLGRMVGDIVTPIGEPQIVPGPAAAEVSPAANCDKTVDGRAAHVGASVPFRSHPA